MLSKLTTSIQTKLSFSNFGQENLKKYSQKMAKQNPMINIVLKRPRYLSPPHFLMFASFRRFSGDQQVFFLTKPLYIRTHKNLYESDCPFVSFCNLKSLFFSCSLSLSLVVSLVVTFVFHCHWFSLVVTRYAIGLCFYKQSNFIV